MNPSPSLFSKLFAEFPSKLFFFNYVCKSHCISQCMLTQFHSHLKRLHSATVLGNWETSHPLWPLCLIRWLFQQCALCQLISQAWTTAIRFLLSSFYCFPMVLGIDVTFWLRDRKDCRSQMAKCHCLVQLALSQRGEDLSKMDELGICRPLLVACQKHLIGMSNKGVFFFKKKKSGLMENNFKHQFVSVPMKKSYLLLLYWH